VVEVLVETRVETVISSGISSSAGLTLHLLVFSDIASF
jgi:hypothetical protein